MNDLPGATLTCFQGQDVVANFGDPAAEYRALRAAAALAPTAWLAALELTGKDRMEWLQGLFSNDLSTLSPGQGCYGVHLTVKGRMVADLRVVVQPESLVLITQASTRRALVESLDRYLIREEVQIRDHTATWDEINVQGPDSPDEAWTALGLHGPSSGAALCAALGPIPELAVDGGAELAGPVLCVRADWTGEPGHDLLVPRKHARALWDALAAHATPVGHTALNAARIEAGTPWYGEDMDEHTIPLEAGLEARAISYTKGCYVGQEVIARIHSQGHVNRHLCGLVLEGDRLPRKGEKLKTAERELGWVVSSVHSPALGKPIALGYVRRDHARPGTRMEVDGIAATVAALPFRPS